MNATLKKLFLPLYVAISVFSFFAEAKTLKTLDPAPLFSTQTHEGDVFNLKDRKGKWTVLYFYPKAGTPGCTKQACAFRDQLQKIRALGADVFGISADTVKQQADFHKEHKLNFTLLADPGAKIITLYGSKLPIVNLARRWTFVVDAHLKIRWIEKDVDPVLDAERVAEQIERLQKSTPLIQ